MLSQGLVTHTGKKLCKESLVSYEGLCTCSKATCTAYRSPNVEQDRFNIPQTSGSLGCFFQTRGKPKACSAFDAIISAADRTASLLGRPFPWPASPEGR
ncbi:hypothetical protein CSC82_09290 [Rhodobacteraceae bacterium 4F10]|nr:hypothetical protein CSC82_09290 [Rhodobacteraceae bacterium 4F10]